MASVERNVFMFLLSIDFGAIILSMVAGPVGNDTVAIASAVSACIISMALVIYSLYFWRRREH